MRRFRAMALAGLVLALMGCGRPAGDAPAETKDDRVAGDKTGLGSPSAKAEQAPPALPEEAQAHGGEEDAYVPETDSLVLKKLEHWQDIKFGLLMHWGPYSQWGIVESWSICAEDEDWCRRPHEDYERYRREYERLPRTFNPSRFDPKRWAAAAKNAGMRYVVFTTKHHDGFCMFDTKLTDYKITAPSCPFSEHPQADVTRAIFEAFRAHGFMLGAYFSKPDWHSPYYWWRNFATPDRHVNYSIAKYPERWEKFVQFTHGQIDELMSRYGELDILWLDGGWVQRMSPEQVRRYVHAEDYNFTRIQSQDIRMSELVAKARAKQPGLIVVDRAVHGPFQNYLTPENRIPSKTLPHPWESPMIAGESWSYKPNAKYLSPRQVVTMLLQIVSRGGNLLLNIAPSPKGEFDSEAYAMLAGVGNWMRDNHEAIYETRPVAPHQAGPLYFTRNRNTGAVYATYLREQDRPLPASFVIPSPPFAGQAAVTLLGSDEPVQLAPKDAGLQLALTPKAREAFGKAISLSFRLSP